MAKLGSAPSCRHFSLFLVFFCGFHGQLVAAGFLSRVTTNLNIGLKIKKKKQNNKPSVLGLKS